MEASNYTPGTGCKEALSSLHHCGGGIGTKGREVEMKGREKKGRDTHGKKIRTRRSGHPRVPREDQDTREFQTPRVLIQRKSLEIFYRHSPSMVRRQKEEE
jgi:hypothetical protein